MRYAKIKHYDIANGEGVRISLFVSGCKFHCKGCFNQEAQDYSFGNLFTDDTINELIKLVSDPNIDGLSILGGDPLWQDENDIKSLINLVNMIHKINKSVWIWSGFTYEELSGIKLQLVNSCDVFVDGQFIEEEKDLRLQWCGSHNQRVIDIPQTLNNNKIILYKGK